jgi:hypothetical protein
MKRKKWKIESIKPTMDMYPSTPDLLESIEERSLYLPLLPYNGNGNK